MMLDPCSVLIEYTELTQAPASGFLVWVRDVLYADRWSGSRVFALLNDKGIEKN